VEVLLVLPEVRRELIDLLREERDLDFGRTAVSIVTLHILYCVRFLAFCEHSVRIYKTAIPSEGSTTIPYIDNICKWCGMHPLTGTDFVLP